MTAAEIAAKLTPAQIRALRDPKGSSWDDWHALMELEPITGPWMMIEDDPPLRLTDFGREVLAVIEKETGK